MASFAQIDENNIVVSVIKVDNIDCAGGKFPESEPVGKAFIASLGIEGNWKQTSYENEFRGITAAIGYFYDEENDVFVRRTTSYPQPFASWTLDETNNWVAPQPYPSEDGWWEWNEELQQWVR
jgi:dipeptidyl aminopeptidase/acylaminoacyl peptidase